MVYWVMYGEEDQRCFQRWNPGQRHITSNRLSWRVWILLWMHFNPLQWTVWFGCIYIYKAVHCNGLKCIHNKIYNIYMLWMLMWIRKYVNNMWITWKPGEC